LSKLLTDEEICSKEIIQYNQWNKKKSEIVKDAAIKLEDSKKYKDDLTKISAVIARLFPEFSSSTIALLDDKYKRDYDSESATSPASEPPDTPTTDLEEFLFILEDNFKAFTKSIKSIVKRSRKNPELAGELEDIFTDTIHEFHTNLGSFMKELAAELFEIEDILSLINYTKKLGIDIKILDEKTDPKALLDATIKFGLKQQFAIGHFRNLGNKMNKVPKFSSKSFESFEALLNHFVNCPKCNFDYADYVNKQKIALASNIDLIKVEPLKLTCMKCKSVKIKIE